MPFSCVSPTDYVDTLMFSTLWPLMFGALLFVIFVGHFFWERRIVLRTYDKRKIGFQMYHLSARLRIKYFTLFLLLTYFILPSVTTSIFAMFPCMNVDPDGVDDLDDLKHESEGAAKVFKNKMIEMNAAREIKVEANKKILLEVE